MNIEHLKKHFEGLADQDPITARMLIEIIVKLEAYRGKYNEVLLAHALLGFSVAMCMDASGMTRDDFVGIVDEIIRELGGDSTPHATA